MTGRTLGIDPGTRRVGVAISDSQGRLATPHSTIDATDEQQVVRDIVALVTENDIVEIVVGHPRNMNGTAGPAAVQAEILAERLRDATGARVSLWDERLSSVQAGRAMLGAGTKRAKRREATDQLAAMIVLQAYLDSRQGRA